jgi:membrane-bound metal-dependent hydrolase YbcI (DUF457 family)
MFIGHFAVGLGAKKFAPRTSLAVLMGAAVLPDLLWALFVLFGWERVRVDPGNTRFTPLDFVYYPWSHSLLMDLVWGGIFALIYYRITRYRPGAVAVFVCGLSYWVLDYISHRADMPLYPGGPRVGLGLWNSVAGTMIVEIGMLAVGAWLYLRASRGPDEVGRYSPIAFVGVLLVLYLVEHFGGTTENVKDLASGGLIGDTTLLIWAGWFDLRRELAPQRGLVRSHLRPIDRL